MAGHWNCGKHPSDSKFMRKKRFWGTKSHQGLWGWHRRKAQHSQVVGKRGKIRFLGRELHRPALGMALQTKNGNLSIKGVTKALTQQGLRSGMCRHEAETPQTSRPGCSKAKQTQRKTKLSGNKRIQVGKSFWDHSPALPPPNPVPKCGCVGLKRHEKGI